jgi:tetratricopeptide (TPR) repeat protein
MESVESVSRSPWFARRAAERIAAGDSAGALRLCVEGAAEYPWYATGAYILGKCYEEMGRVGEAVLEFRRAAALMPDARVVREALTRAERKERESFEAFAVQQLSVLQHKAGSIGFEEYVAGETGAAEGSADFLRKQAEIARHEREHASAEKKTEKSPQPPTRIVTVTLAEIFAGQGEYGEAIQAYRLLVQRRPEETERFQKRIRELEVLAAAATEKPLE